MTNSATKPLNLFIIGPSGCGKSTQAELIAKEYGLTHLSMGQILRDEIASASQAGLDAKKYVDQGIPVPDDIVLPLISQSLKKINNKNFIIDGFPRLIDQGKYVDHYLQDNNLSVSSLIHLLVDFQEIIKRRQRLKDEFQDKSRTDNNPTAIANRQKVLYESNVAPILEHYQGQNKLFEVDGNRPIEPIFADIKMYIDNILKV